MSIPLREYIQERVLLFEGAMGTYYAGSARRTEPVCERANLSCPEQILSIHLAYREAGARAVKTNTFTVNRFAFPDPAERAEILKAGFALASRAAGEDGYVFADIGPVTGQPEEETAEALTELADSFLALGAKHFLIETQGSAAPAEFLCRYIRQKAPESYLLVSFAVMPDGFSFEGVPLRDLLSGVPGADAVGVNCLSGPTHTAKLLPVLLADGRPVCVMPNAGYPGREAGRTLYGTRPGFFAERTACMVQSGVAMAGGCCGTGPEHIRALHALIKDMKPFRAEAEKTGRKTPPLPPAVNRLREKLEAGKKVILVEYDPPATANLISYMEGVSELKEAGADAITLADCPMARAGVDASLLACKVKRELDIDPIPHMTCRDRNRNAAKALLLGLSGEGVHNVLLVTGDPVPTEERDSVKSVFQYDAARLAQQVRSYEEEGLLSKFLIFGALNVNAMNFAVELKRAQRKAASGVEGFLTQPVLTEAALENLKAARETLPGSYLLCGIIPPVSEKNARFMDAEVRGIRVDSRIIDAFRGLDRAGGERLGARISLEAAKRAEPYCDGFYLITPFKRTALMAELVRKLRETE